MGTVFDPKDAQTAQEAAELIAWLSTLPAGATAPYGALVEKCRVIPFGD
jgi:hypothetical protein